MNTDYLNSVLDSLHLLQLMKAFMGFAIAVFGDKQELNEAEKNLLEGMFCGGLFNDYNTLSPIYTFSR